MNHDVLLMTIDILKGGDYGLRWLRIINQMSQVSHHE